MTVSHHSRRAVLAGGLVLPFVARTARAQGQPTGEPIRLGTLTPQTGSGGPYGPPMARTAKAVADEINAAGGVLGRPLLLVQEDDETNPDAAVRAARKLIDVDKVHAVMGTWASAVTTAVAPLCWESRTMLFTVSGADSITKLPHQGYIVRTQPNTQLQSLRAAQYLLQQGSKRVFALSAQTPFAVDGWNRLSEVLKEGGAEPAGNVIYDASKTSFRSEVDQALRSKPDTLYLNGYAPDTSVILRELFRAGFEGRKFTYGYAANAQMVASLPQDVTEGLISFSPSPDTDSPAYKRVQAILGTQDPDTYSCQIHDHVNLAALAIAKAGSVSGQAIHDAIRMVSQGGGEKVYGAAEGIRLLAGKDVNYEGASGPCDLLPSGDIETCKFRFEAVERGKLKLLTIS